MKMSYFAGANTVDGFVSYYREIFGELDRVYIIKGGSGTGKSRLMKEIADASESKGRWVEYFYCSFDPTSLDGVIIDGTMAVIDGTAPHTCEPALPGAMENLIDLGAFWDESVLHRRRDEIKSLVKAKRKCFDEAYAYLSAIKALDRIKRNIADKYLKRDSFVSEASKLVPRINSVGEAKTAIRLVESVGMKGRARFDSFEALADETYILCDKYGVGHLLIEEIKKEADRGEIPVTVSFDPLFKDRPNALLLGGRTAVLLSKTEGECLPMTLHDREELDRLEAQSEFFESKAVSCLQKAAEIHFGIESIYVSAMDFDKKERFTRDFINTHI